MTTRNLYKAEMLVTSARDSLSYIIRKLEDPSIGTREIEYHLKFAYQHLAEFRNRLLPMRDHNWQEKVEQEEDDLIPY